MILRPSKESISKVLQKSIYKGIIADEDTAVIFYDLTFLENRILQIKKQFPPDSIHAVAVKAIPLLKILNMFGKLNTGLEAASLPELYLALECKFKPGDIFFDSPAKTKTEIELALKTNINLNIDSLPELARVSEIMKASCSKSNIGLRINPQVGLGTIALTSVAGEYSKFGIPINECKDEIISAYKINKWLNGIHLHIGSQGCSLEMLVEGVKKVYDLTLEVNSLEECTDQIKIFDIGGGFPVSYYFNKLSVTIEEYVDALLSVCPLLFTKKFNLVTEFGRYISANAGWTASRVEYVKESHNLKTAIIHVGADMFLRKCYRPEDWHHELSVCDSKGALKPEIDKQKYIVAGPLCFAGDIIAENVRLPVINADDFLIIHDTGAYTLSMWSRYNSRQIPKVIGYYNDGEDFIVIKERENISELITFWH